MDNFFRKILRRIPGAVLITVGLAHGLDEAEVFEWWDGGMISAEEASEMLNLLEEGNEEEACLLAEAYSLESCSSVIAESSKGKNGAGVSKNKVAASKGKSGAGKKERRETSGAKITPHGYVSWKGRTDSLGHLESSRMELQMDFYRYRLRLGSQELLSYRNEGAEAHFGQVSTREIHSYIPLDTLWGTSLQYPLGNLLLAGTLDTALNTQARLGYRLGKHQALAASLGRGASVDMFCWQSRDEESCGLQGNASWGQFAGWWQRGQNLPLIKLQFQHSEKLGTAGTQVTAADHPQEHHDGSARNHPTADRAPHGDAIAAPSTLSWKFSAYFHGDSVPSQARLSKSILQNRFWSSQTVAYTNGGPWRSKATVNSRIMTPLDTAGGNSSGAILSGGVAPTTARFKLQAESGPQVFRGTASVTCLDAAENCTQDDLKASAISTLPWNSSTLQDRISLQGSVKSRYTRGDGLSIPRIETGANYSQGAVNSAGITFIFPKANPAEEMQIRTQANVGTEFLQTSFVVTFRKKTEEPLHPLRAYLQIKSFF